MSRPRSEPIEKPTGPEGATLARDATLTGVVRTSKGFAVVRLVLTPGGAVKSCRVGRSQAQIDFIAAEHKNMLVMDALGVLKP